MRIHVEEFLGIAPKQGEHLLDNRRAQIAEDCNLWSQALRPIDGDVDNGALSKLAGEIQTLYRYQSNWLCWTQDVDAVKGPIANDPLDRLYFTGTDKPRVTTSSLWNAVGPGTSLPPASYILGIPAPTTTPVASDVGAGNITGDVSYAFTYVRKYSDGTLEESAPSLPSNQLTLAARRTSVTLPEDAITFADYGITHKRTYRSTGGSAFFFVNEVALGVTPTTDNLTVAALGDAIESTLYLPPPDTLKGLIQLPNGCLAGFKDNVVYVSDPQRPHAYPLLNRYVVNDTIVSLGNVGTTIVVATNSRPEIGRGVDPAAYSFVRSPGFYPCTSKRSMKSGDIGVLWATPRGMAISDGVSVQMASAEFLTRKEWRTQFFPDTIHAMIHDGRYYGWFSRTVDADGNKLGGGFVLDKNERAFLTTLGSYVEAAFALPQTDGAYVSKKSGGINKVFEWNADADNPTPFTWKSKLYIHRGVDNYAFAQIVADYFAGLTQAEIDAINAQIAAAQASNLAITDDDGVIDGSEINGSSGFVFGEIDGDGVTTYLPAGITDIIAGALVFTYWGDRQVKLLRLVTSNDPFPMPAGFAVQQDEFQVQGEIQVHSVTIAGSMEELSADG